MRYKYRKSKAGVFLIVILLLASTIVITGASNNSSEQSNEVRLLVKFKPSTSQSTKQAIANTYKLAEESELSETNIIVFRVPEQTQQTVLNALQKNPNVEFAEPDQIFQPALLTNDALRNGGQYPLSTMHLPQAWDYSLSNTVVRVSNPDTGIDATHPDLAPNFLMDLAYNSADGSSNVAPVYPHGTSTAGCLGAKTNNELGIASSSWSTEIIPIRVSNSADGSASITALYNAIIYAANNGAKVVTESYGVGGSSTINAAGQYLRETTDGLLFVSAGNNNAYVTSPNYPYIIVVAATDSSDHRAYFSNYGPFVDLAAPGVSVYSTYGPSGYSYVSGTSFSSPLAASVATYLYSVYPDATALQVEQALLNGATDLGATGRDDYFGYGRVDSLGAYLAYNNIEIDTTPPTVLITSPATGSTVTGTITIDATASDNVGVTKVEFYRGTTLLSTDTTEPYSCSWDTTTVTNGAYTLQAKAYDAMNNVGSSDVVQVTVDNPLQPGIFYANQDINVQNGGISGSYSDTQTSNDIYESITERESGGKPSNRYSYLEHKWTINVAGGYGTYIFHIEAYHTTNSEGDDFTFAYSTDDSTYIDMFTVVKTADDDNYQMYILPSTLSGTIYIRVLDADQTSGNRGLDAIYIDHMYIEAGGTPPPNRPPSNPADPTPSHGATNVDTSPMLSVYVEDPDNDVMDVAFYGVGNGVPIYTVYGVASGSYASIVWNGLDYETAYSWYAVADDGKFNSNYDIWTFTTRSNAPPTDMYVSEISWSERIAGKNIFLSHTVAVMSAEDVVVSGATVYSTLTNIDTGKTSAFSGVTDETGKVSFEQKCKSGHYEAFVTDIVHTTYDYNHALDVDNPSDYTIS